MLISIMAVSPIDGVKVDVQLDSHEVYPQEPVVAGMEFVIDEAATEICGVALTHSSIRIGVMNDAGDTVLEPVAGPKRGWGRYPVHWGFSLDDGPRARHRLILNEWHSTNLPPGEYVVRIELDEIAIERCADRKIAPENGAILHTYKTYPCDVRWELPLTIVEDGEGTVRAQYEELLADALADGNEARMARAREVLCYTREKAALPYQLDLFFKMSPADYYTPDYMHQLLDTDLIMQFVNSNDPIVAHRLTEFLSQSRSRTGASGKAELVRWALFQMHDEGSAAVKAITESVVEHQERPADPRPVPGLD